MVLILGMSFVELQTKMVIVEVLKILVGVQLFVGGGNAKSRGLLVELAPEVVILVVERSGLLVNQNRASNSGS